MFSTWIMSGLWLGYSRTISALRWRFVLDYRPADTSIWDPVSISTIIFYLFSRMWMKFPFLMILWTLPKFPVPLKEKYHHYIIILPPWFIETNSMSVWPEILTFFLIIPLYCRPNAVIFYLFDVLQRLYMFLPVQRRWIPPLCKTHRQWSETPSFLLGPVFLLGT